MTYLNGLTIEENHTIESDICIIGGGAVGIAIAKEFIGTRQNVLLLESGDYEFDRETQSLYDVEIVGHPLKMVKDYVPRNRYLGGSTNTWAGRCAPLNDIDFEYRDWVPNSGWPIDKTELDIYYQQASKVLKIFDFEDFYSEEWKKYILEYKDDFLDNNIFSPEVFQFAKTPVNMKSSYIKELEDAPNIKICTNSNVTEIEPHESLKNVIKLHVSSMKRNRFFVTAKIYILACGGWENTRLLLLSRRYSNNGLGNQNDVLGRYYMEHPKIISGVISPRSNTLKSPILLTPKKIKNGFTLLGIKLSDNLQKKERLLNHYVELCPLYPEGIEDSLESFKSLVKNLNFSSSTVNNFVQSMPYLWPNINFFTRKYLNLPIPFHNISLINHFEQAPNRESRIMLSSQKDALGLSRLKINLQISSEEKRCMVRHHEILRDYLKEKNLGDMTTNFPDVESTWTELTDSYHHMGTTRMSLNPKEGVVNEHCQVHGIDNLYIASSSVFPTSGHVNPTLTIVALALRLANHLKDVVLPKIES